MVIVYEDDGSTAGIIVITHVFSKCCLLSVLEDVFVSQGIMSQINVCSTNLPADRGGGIRGS